MKIFVMIFVAVFAFGFTNVSAASEPVGVQRTFEDQTSIYLLDSHVFPTETGAQIFFSYMTDGFQPLLEDLFTLVEPASSDSYSQIDALDDLGDWIEDENLDIDSYTVFNFDTYDDGLFFNVAAVMIRSGKNVHVWSLISMTDEAANPLVDLVIEKMTFTQSMNVKMIKRTMPKTMIGYEMKEEVLSGEEI